MIKTDTMRRHDLQNDDNTLLEIEYAVAEEAYWFPVVVQFITDMGGKGIDVALRNLEDFERQGKVAKGGTGRVRLVVNKAKQKLLS